jgi:hypothetical protein
MRGIETHRVGIWSTTSDLQRRLVLERRLHGMVPVWTLVDPTAHRIAVGREVRPLFGSCALFSSNTTDVLSIEPEHQPRVDDRWPTFHVCSTICRDEEFGGWNRQGDANNKSRQQGNRCASHG